MAVETFIIEIQQRGAQQTQTQLKGLHDEVRRGADIMAFFRQALVAFSFARAASNALEFVDSVTRINNRLKIATGTAEEYARAQQFIYKVSNQTRTEVEANAVTYSRLIQSTKALGLSTDQLETVMTGLANSIIIGGASSQEAKNALIQFSQSLASGALRGDELNSVVEQLPALANAIGRQFGLADGQLRNFIKNNPGLVDTSKVIQAVLQESKNLAEQAAKANPTIAQSFTVLSNNFKLMLNTVNEGTNVFGIIARVVLVAAQNINVLAIAAAAFIALRVGTAVSGWVSGFIAANNVVIRLIGQLRIVTAAQTAWNAAMLANPIGAILALVVAFGLGLVALYNNVKPVHDAINGAVGVLGELFSIVGQVTGAIAEALFGWVDWNTAANGMGEALGFVIRVLVTLVAVGLSPMVLAMGLAVDVMSRMGIVSKDTAQSVWNGVQAYNNATASLIANGFSAEQATKGNEALGQTVDKGRILFDGLGGGADKASEKMMKHASATRDTSNALFDWEQQVTRTNGKVVAITNSIDGMAASGAKVGPALSSSSVAIEMSTKGFDNLTARMSEWNDYSDKGTTSQQKLSNSVQKTAQRGDELRSSLEKAGASSNQIAERMASAAKSFDASATSAGKTATNVEATSKALDSANPKIDAAGAASDSASSGFSKMAEYVAGATSAVWKLVDAFNKLADAKARAGEGGSSTGSANFGGARAVGGPVKGGSTYLVGEKGPELFTPSTSGSITTNRDLNAMAKGGSGSSTLASISKSMAKAANAMTAIAPTVVEVATNTKAVAQAVDYAASSYSFNGFTPKTVDQYDGAHQSYMQYGMNIGVPPKHGATNDYATPEQYAEWMKNNQIIQGDQAYQQNIKDVLITGINYARSYQYDANSPLSNEIEDVASKIAETKALLERYGGADGFWQAQMTAALESYQQQLADLQGQQSQALAWLKQARETNAAWQQFQAALPGIAAQKSSVTDFQTYTPWQDGGKTFAMTDKYGIGSTADRLAANNGAANDNRTINQDNSTKVNVTIVANDANSFRNNKAQVEDSILGAVNRAKRRSNR